MTGTGGGFASAHCSCCDRPRVGQVWASCPLLYPFLLGHTTTPTAPHVVDPFLEVQRARVTCRRSAAVSGSLFSAALRRKRGRPVSSSSAPEDLLPPAWIVFIRHLSARCPCGTPAVPSRFLKERALEFPREAVAGRALGEQSRGARSRCPSRASARQEEGPVGPEHGEDGS